RRWYFKLFRDFGDTLRTPIRIFGQTSRDDFFPRRVNRVAFDFEFLASLRHRRRNFLTNLPINVARIKWRSTREQFVDASSERIDIIEMSAPLTVELLRAHVNQRATLATFHRELANRIA